MKITIEFEGIKIEVDENGQKDRTATLKYSDQNKQIQETIKVMTEQMIKLKESIKK